MKIQFWARTDVGRKRSHNEDNFLVDKKLNLYVVCDGMGGHASGEVASATAVKEVHEKISLNRDLIERYAQKEEGTSKEDIRILLEQAVKYACYKIYDIGQKDKKKRGMGTTLSLILIVGDEGFMAHVGDSRIYRVRGTGIDQLTKDHSLLNELIERGKVKSEKDIKFPFKNAVTRAVGVFDTVDVDIYECDIQEGDFFLLCSDGLHGYFEGEPLLDYLDTDRPDSWVDRLIDAANEAGGKDNITAVAVKVLNPSEAERYDATQKKIDTLKLIPLFKYLNHKELLRVLEVTSEQLFEPGTILFNEGDDGDCLYIVLAGDVQIIKNGVELTHLGAGCHFGEMALIDRVPRSATARAAKPLESVVFTRDQFFDLLRNDATLAVKLLWSFVRTLSARLRDTTGELAQEREKLRTLEQGDLDPLAVVSPDVVSTASTEIPPSLPELDPQFDGDDRTFDDEEHLIEPDELLDLDERDEDRTAVKPAARTRAEREEAEEIDLDDEDDSVGTALAALTQLVEQEKTERSLDEEMAQSDDDEDERSEALAALTSLVATEKGPDPDSVPTVELRVPGAAAESESEAETGALAALNQLVESEKAARIGAEERVSLGVSVGSAAGSEGAPAALTEAQLEDAASTKATVEMRVDPAIFEQVEVRRDETGRAVVTVRGMSDESDIEEDIAALDLDAEAPDMRRRTVEMEAVAIDITDDLEDQSADEKPAATDADDGELDLDSIEEAEVADADLMSEPAAEDERTTPDLPAVSDEVVDVDEDLEASTPDEVRSVGSSTRRK
ncbi:MAG: Stp1/IreP family PP2C-type Ser/Thr phosphatase, partial [Myxococcales bacterium]|nr:Stp1/IreP family PP2C-type Ser/Thr phosphatase [Myxococcales bacterium]